MSSKKPPKKLYITSYYENGDKTLVPFGCLGEYKPGIPTYENKMRAQEQTSYIDNSGLIRHTARIEKRANGDWFVCGESWAWNISSNNRIQEERLIETPPVIWDNEPMSGFKIDKYVSRWSTNNKYWRIVDPRGVQFEVSTDCLHNLIMEAGISKGGEIMGECLWFSNRRLIVAS